MLLEIETRNTTTITKLPVMKESGIAAFQYLSWICKLRFRTDVERAKLKRIKCIQIHSNIFKYYPLSPHCFPGRKWATQNMMISRSESDRPTKRRGITTKSNANKSKPMVPHQLEKVLLGFLSSKKSNSKCPSKCQATEASEGIGTFAWPAAARA